MPGAVPWNSKNLAFPRGNGNIPPLRAPPVPRARGDTPNGLKVPFWPAAPLPISPKSTLLNHTSRYLSFRTPGPYLTPTPDPSRGRRIDWPAATAGDPGKNTWNSDRHCCPHVFRPGAPLVTVVATFFDIACDSKCKESFATVVATCFDAGLRSPPSSRRVST